MSFSIATFKFEWKVATWCHSISRCRRLIVGWPPDPLWCTTCRIFPSWHGRDGIVPYQSVAKWWKSIPVADRHWFADSVINSTLVHYNRSNRRNARIIYGIKITRFGEISMPETDSSSKDKWRSLYTNCHLIQRTIERWQKRGWYFSFSY